MNQKQPPVIENPSVYVGILKDAPDQVALVLEPGKPQEQRIVMAPLVAMAVAAELAKYAREQLDRQAAAMARHAHNTTERRPKLDA